MPPFPGFWQAKIKNTRSLVMLDKLAATTTTVNQVLAKDVSNGTVVPATSSTVRSEIEGICNLSIAPSDNLLQVPAIEIGDGDTWIADTRNNTDPAHNYQRMLLTDSLTVNNTGTDDVNGVVEQVEPYGAPSDKKAIFKFV